MKFTGLYMNMPLIEIRFTHSLKRARRVIKKMCGSADSWQAIASNARTSCLTHPQDGTAVYLVWMDDDLERPASADAALLAHEAVHVAIDYLKCIGEDEPGEELRAYTVQTITQYLCERHFAWKKRKLKQAE